MDIFNICAVALIGIAYLGLLCSGEVLYKQISKLTGWKIRTSFPSDFDPVK